MRSKKMIRAEVIRRLQQLTARTRQQASRSLYQQLFALPAWHQAQTVAVTMSQPLELATAPIITAAQHENKTVLIPKTLPQRQMAFIPLTTQTIWRQSAFGIQEPQNGTAVAPTAIDLIIVPGVAFAQNGARVGFGGGYYDRFLPQTSARTIALALPGQFFLTPDWPVDAFDVTLDEVIETEDIQS